MNSSDVVISVPELALGVLLVIALAAVCRPLSRQTATGLVTSMGRMCLQLTLLGLVLKAVFDNVSLVWVALVSLVMLLAAGREVVIRQRYRGPWASDWRTGLTAMTSGCFLLTLLALLVVIEHEPWYHPRYAIPLLGMMLGNTMTGIALTISRILEGAHQQAPRIQARLALGDTWQDAVRGVRIDGIRQGLLPVINMMAASGLVSLPGMMTGQLLAGADPMDAVSYQILIILMIATGAGAGSLIAAHLTVRQLFDDRERLRLDYYRDVDSDGSR